MLAQIKLWTQQADHEQLSCLCEEIEKRYAQLSPRWETHFISLEKDDDRQVQIDRIIHMLNSLR